MQNKQFNFPIFHKGKTENLKSKRVSKILKSKLTKKQKETLLFEKEHLKAQRMIEMNYNFEWEELWN